MVQSSRELATDLQAKSRRWIHWMILGDFHKRSPTISRWLAKRPDNLRTDPHQHQTKFYLPSVGLEHVQKTAIYLMVKYHGFVCFVKFSQPQPIRNYTVTNVPGDAPSRRSLPPLHRNWWWLARQGPGKCQHHGLKTMGKRGKFWAQKQIVVEKDTILIQVCITISMKRWMDFNAVNAQHLHLFTLEAIEVKPFGRHGMHSWRKGSCYGHEKHFFLLWRAPDLPILIFDYYLYCSFKDTLIAQVKRKYFSWWMLNTIRN